MNTVKICQCHTLQFNFMVNIEPIWQIPECNIILIQKSDEKYQL